MRYLYTTLLPAGISPISRGHRMTKLCRIMRDEKFLFLQETSSTCDDGGGGGWWLVGTMKMMTVPWYFVSFPSELVTFLWHLLALIIDRWFVWSENVFKVLICVESEIKRSYLLTTIINNIIFWNLTLKLNSELQTKKLPRGRDWVRTRTGTGKHFTRRVLSSSHLSSFTVLYL